MAKILILEAEDFLKYLYGPEICGMGYEVISARDRDEALKEIRFNSPEVLIVDLALPDMENFSLLHTIWQLKPGMPFLIYAAYSDYRTNILNTLQREFSIKSFDVREFKEAVQWILTRGFHEEFKSYRVAEFGI